MQPLKDLSSEKAAPLAAGLREDNDDIDDGYGPAALYEADVPLLILDKLPASVVIDLTNIKTARALAFYVSVQLFSFAANYFRLQDAQKVLPGISHFSGFILDALAAWNVMHPEVTITSGEFYVMLDNARRAVMYISDDEHSSPACYS